MRFLDGLRSWQYFPSNDSVFDLAYIQFKDIQSYSHKLSLNNYFENDGGSIDQDLRILSECDNHARETNDFYNGGQLQNKVTEWIRLGTEVKNLKSKILPGEITKDIMKYNDNLERAKKERILAMFKQACSDFNSAMHVKKEGYTEYIDWYDEWGTYWYQEIWHEPEYYQIQGYYGYNYQSLAGLESLMQSMERESGYSIVNPKDWRKKLLANGRDDSVFKGEY